MNRRRTVLWGVVVAAAVAIVVAAAVVARDPSLRDVGPPAAEACRPVTDHPAGGASDHVQGTVEYEHVPPNSGQHSLARLLSPRRLYEPDQAPPPEQVVHNLEHGYVVLWYDPAAADVGALKRLVDAVDERTVFATPWPRGGLPAPYVLSAWGHERQCTQPSGEALADFVAAYAGTRGQAPEGHLP